MNGYLIALIVFVAWIVLIYVLHRRKWFEKHGMSLMGPAVMWKTRKGRDFIDKMASAKRLWDFYGKLALWICAGSMVTIMVLLLWEATIVSQVKQPPSPELILGIPGVNPVIPLGYGVLALVIAIVVHELSHGILTRLAGLKIISLGLLFLVFPIGAFVEPDEKELQATTRTKRSKVYAVGPASNIILALVVLGLFSGVMMSSLEPKYEGALAIGIVGDSPVSKAGLKPNSVIVSVDGMQVSNGPDMLDRVSPTPGSMVNISYYYKGELGTAEVVDGLVVAYAAMDFAAYDAGLESGMVITVLNGTVIGNFDALADAMDLCRPSQVVNVTVMNYDGSSGTFQVNHSISQMTLSDKWDYYDRYDPSANEESYRGVAYMGAGFLNLGIDARNVTYYSRVLANPFQGDRNIDDFSRSWLRLIALPFLDLAPVHSPVTDLYKVSGSGAWLGDTGFWLISNSLYWVFWLNLMVGLTNVLPMVPLDGGYIFKDAFDYLVSRFSKVMSKENRDRVVGNVMLFLSLFVFGLILWQIVGPAL